MPNFATDQVLWYNNGIWGELGYAVPNFGNDPATLNSGIKYLADVIGENLFRVMQHTDADLRTPPSINTLARINKLILRARTIMAGRDVPASEPTMESLHASPAPQDFLIFPVPYFKVRNPWLKEYCGLVLAALSEAFQHTENRKAYDFSTTFSGLVGQYLHRVYRLMCTELFGVPVEEASRLDYTLTDAVLASYDPTKFFTQTEMTDTVPILANVPTEDDMQPLRDGIPASLLVGLCIYPTGALVSGAGGVTTAASGSTATTPSTSAFQPAPSP